MDNREQDEADDGALQCSEACSEKAVGLADDGVGYRGVQKMPGKLCKRERHDKTDDEANRLDRQGRHVKILDDEIGEEQVREIGSGNSDKPGHYTEYAAEKPAV